LYVPIGVKLNQEGTINREQGINDFRTSAGRWFQFGACGITSLVPDDFGSKLAWCDYQPMIVHIASAGLHEDLHAHTPLEPR